jgi:hypothetical protein
LPRSNIPGFHWYAVGSAALACLLLFRVPAPPTWPVFARTDLLETLLDGGSAAG